MALIDKASLLMVPSTYEAGKLYNVLPSGNRAPDSTGENSGYDQTRADFDFDRGSNTAATRVNADGLIEKYRENLLLQSNQFDTTWVSINTTETGGQEDKDGGTSAWLISKSASGARVQQAPISVTGVQTLSVYAKAGTLNWIALSNNLCYVYFDLLNGTIGTEVNNIDSSITNVGNGWFHCTMTYNGSAVDARFYPSKGDNDSTGSSGSIYIQNAQLESGTIATDYLESTSVTGKAGVLIDLPRIDYSSGAGALLLEPQRANLVPYSEYFETYTYYGSPTITHNNITSPEGLLNGTKVVRGTNAVPIRVQSITSLGTEYTMSIWAKAGTASQISIDIGNESAPTYDLTSEWQRFEVTSTPSSSTHIDITMPTASVGEYIYIYGLQLEAGSYSTSYIPNHGESGGVTRAADSCLLNNSSALPTSYPFTLYTESIIKSIGSEFLMSFLNASDNVSYASMYVSSGIPTLNARSGSSDVAVASPNSVSEGSVKIVGVFESSTLKLFVNGALKASISNTTTFQSGWNDLLIGQLRTITDTGSRTTNKQAIVFPTALTDAECVTLTTL